MNKVILICGKICAGKTTYAKRIANDINAVILSVDEITLTLFGQYIGDKHDEMVEKTEKYLLKKTVELVSKGIDVILDWGFWMYKERQFVTKYFTDLKIKVEWHYVKVDNVNWQKYLSKRNCKIKNNMENFYFIDNAIAEKFWNIFEEPQPDEIDIWYDNNVETSEDNISLNEITLNNKKIGVSACLAGKICRYDGQYIGNKKIEEFMEKYNVFVFCPEIQGGLPTPREQAEIQDGDGIDVWNNKSKVMTINGNDVTEEYKKGACSVLKMLKKENISTVILKEGSPSCGSSIIHDGSFSGTKKNGVGVAAALFRENKILVYGDNEVVP
jgi:uncharacterized protein YbbK (DUF523 family)/predicted kinase